MKTLLAIVMSPVILAVELCVLAFFIVMLSISPKTMWWFWPLMIGIGCLADMVIS